MAISLVGADGTTVVAADPTMKAMKVTLRPIELLAYANVGVQSGAITGLAANAPIFSFRNLSSNLIVIRRVGVNAILTTAFTTPQIVDFGLMVGRAFTASDAGGTQIAITGNNCKERTSLAAPTSLDCRVATTGTLTAGTRTLDANTLAQASFWGGAAGAALGNSSDNMLSQSTGDYPLILAQNEGFVVQALTAWGAAGVGRAYINFEFAETTSY